jgi:TM2 domain-containing membrane protein YozV
MKCYNHPQVEADGFCVYCGKPFCKQCLAEIGGKYYCHQHIDKAFDTPQYNSQQANSQPPDDRQQYVYGPQSNGEPPRPQNTQPQNIYSQQPAQPPQQWNNTPPQTVIYNNYGGYPPVREYPYKSRLVAGLLCLFIGYLGIHRFYVGKIGTGLLWFFTAGFFGIGWLLDLLFIILGFFRDKAGYPLK